MQPGAARFALATPLHGIFDRLFALAPPGPDLGYFTPSGESGTVWGAGSLHERFRPPASGSSR